MIRSALIVTVACTAITSCTRQANTDELAARDIGVGSEADVSISPMVSDPMVPERMEGISLLGDTLWRPSLTVELRERLERDLAVARAGVEAAPEDADSLIWLGRRLAYLGRYREAVATFTRGVQAHPNDSRFLRHRGHRFLTLRDLEPAIADFKNAAKLEQRRADAIEPDGAPNAANIPLSTTQYNIWYHLGLAHFLRGDFTSALDAYDQCLKVSQNPDLLVATAYWRYLTLRRLDRDAEASASLTFATDTLTLIENDGYLALLRLFKGTANVSDVMPPTPAGEMDVANSTTAFGVSMWHLLNDRPDQARDLWTRIVAGGQWAAFGSLAAESELARLRR